MISVGQQERATQNRVIQLFRAELGYRYLGIGIHGRTTGMSSPNC